MPKRSYTPAQIAEEFERIIDERFAIASKSAQDAVMRASAQIAVKLGSKAEWKFSDIGELEGALEQALADGGMDDVLAEVLKAAGGFKEFATRIEGVTLQGEAGASLQASLQGKFAGYDKLIGDNATGWLRDRMLSQTVAPVTAEKLAQELSAQLTDTLKPYADTYISDAMSGQARATWLAVGDELGAEEFEYLGAPPDGVIRKFCEDHYEGVYTREEIDAMDNGQGLSVWEFGGGYNCRHQWVPIPPKSKSE